MSQLNDEGRTKMHSHYICLCDGDNNLDVTIESEQEEPSLAEAALLAALQARKAKRDG